jgi:hypothetical protein
MRLEARRHLGLMPPAATYPELFYYAVAEHAAATGVVAMCRGNRLLGCRPFCRLIRRLVVQNRLAECSPI